MWTIYQVRWDFITPLCASVPGSSKLIEGWLRSRAPTVRPPQSKSFEQMTQEVLETLAEPVEEEAPQTLVFQRVEGVLAVRYATIKAHLKDCAYQLQTYVAGYAQGEKSLRAKVANTVYPPIPALAPMMMFHGTPFLPILGPDGQPLREPNGIRTRADGSEDGVGPREKAIHVNTAQGQRSALKAFEFCHDVTLEFPLAVLTAADRAVKKGKEIIMVPGRDVVNEDDLKTLMLYGCVHGYGGERSEDGGRYAFTITRKGTMP
jgi:hypothetical protein